MTVEDLPDEVRSILRLRHSERARLADIAVELGVCERTVMRWMRLMGLRFLAEYVPDEEIAAMALEGRSAASIASAFGLAEHTVSVRLYGMGLKRGAQDYPMHRFRDAAAYDAEPPRKPSSGMFEPVEIGGDGPLARRYREQLENRSKLQEPLDD